MRTVVILLVSLIIACPAYCQNGTSEAKSNTFKTSDLSQAELLHRVSFPTSPLEELKAEVLPMPKQQTSGMFPPKPAVDPLPTASPGISDDKCAKGSCASSSCCNSQTRSACTNRGCSCANCDNSCRGKCKRSKGEGRQHRHRSHKSRCGC